MTCSEARQYIFAFLDNELDSALSLEMQQHIEHCPLCARECEIETVVRKQLAHKIQQADDVLVFEESALLRLVRPEAADPAHARRIRLRNWRLATGGAIAAALLLAVTLFVANRPREVERVPFVDAVVDDFDHFITEAKSLQIVSADAKDVSDWLRDRTALAVSVPLVDSAMGTLLGGRKCKINGVPAAFAIYRIGDEMVSVVALRGSDEALARMKRIDRDGHTHWIDHCRDHTVLACRRGELIYAIVSRLPEESLFPLMPPADG